MFQEIVMINYERSLSERAKSRKMFGPYRWTPSKPGTGRGFYQASKGLWMDQFGSSIDLRLQDANEFLGDSRLSFINGYYCDRLGDGDSLQPIIARLPRSRGFLAGWTMGRGMCASLGPEVWETEREAACAAHDMAEHDADHSRESQEDEDDDALDD